jgi:dCTP deaminase
MALSNVDIRKAIDAKEIIFDPPLDSDRQVQPASVDLRLGAKIFKTSPDPAARIIGEGEYLAVEPQEFVQAITYERMELSSGLVGRFGIKSALTRKGLYLFSGIQVDPGWRGYLVVSLFNTSTQPIAIRFKEPFCSIEFDRVQTPADPPYRGIYLNQTDFSSEDVSWLMRARGMTFGQVVQAVQDLQSSVKSLDSTVKELRASLAGLRTDMRIWLTFVAIVVTLASILSRVL